MSIKRPTWDEYFLKIALLVAERSTCRRRHIGAIIVHNKRILSTGYNGAASGMVDCLELGCLRDQRSISSGQMQEVCRAIHAEQNAIIQAALYGVSTADSTMYCTLSPCILCARMIVNAKITRYVTFSSYAETDFLKLFGEANVKYEVLPPPNPEITVMETRERA